jgi:hypothetical protein
MQFCLFDEALREQAYELLAHYLGPGYDMKTVGPDGEIKVIRVRGDVKTIRQCFEMLALQAHTGEPIAYDSFKKEKKRKPDGTSGGYRLILAPQEPLKGLLRLFKTELFDRCPMGRSAHGFRSRRSVLTNARLHLENGSRYALNFDVKDCFPSTPVYRIEKVLKEAIGRSMYQEGAPREVADMVMKVMSELMTFRYGRVLDIPALPMGTPASPSMINLIFRSFDERLLRALRKREAKTGQLIVFSRYGDDGTLSSAEKLPPELAQLVANLLHNIGYKPNTKKTKWMEAGSHEYPIEVTGIIVSPDKNRLLLPDDWIKKTERDLIQFIYHPFGNPKSRETQARKIRGKLNLCRGVYFGGYPVRIANALRSLNDDPRPFVTDRLWELSGRKRKKDDARENPPIDVDRQDELEEAEEDFAEDILADGDEAIDENADFELSPYPY